MTITKGSRAAHERSLKAAETRRRNKASGGAPAFPASYHARPTQHVTRDLRMKQTVKKPKQPRQIPLSRIRTASIEELEAAFNRMNAPGYEHQRGDDKRYYALKDEIRLRYNPNLSLHMQRAGYRKVGGKTVKKRQQKRVSAKQPRPEGSKPHRRKDLYKF